MFFSFCSRNMFLLSVYNGHYYNDSFDMRFRVTLLHLLTESVAFFVQ